MRKILAPVPPLAGCFFKGGDDPWATRYVYGGRHYAVLGDATAEPGGACALFTKAMGVRGSFTTAIPLEPNLQWENIAPLLLAFTFCDGLTTYVSSDPRVRVGMFTVSTDADGAITGFSARIDRYHGTAAPHAAGDRLDQLYILDGLMTVGIHNAICAMVGPGPDGAPDTCQSASADTATSYGEAPPGGYPVVEQLAVAGRPRARRSWRRSQLLQ